MRDINDSLDPEIESEITRREDEDGDIAALLDRIAQGDVRKDDEQNKTASQAGQAESLNNPVLAAAVTQGTAAAMTGGTGESNPVEEKAPVAELTEIVDKETGKSCIRTMSSMTNSAEIQTRHRKQCDRMNAIW